MPLIRPIRECADPITPADDVSDHFCGATGSIFFLGALGAVVWSRSSNQWKDKSETNKSIVFMRVVWLHISVCWNRVPGKTVMYMSISSGIAIPLILLAVALRFSGFSYQLGPTCFINHEHSFAVFWGWLVGFTVAAFVAQLVTSAYCVHVYVMCYRLRQGSASTIKSEGTSSSWGTTNLEETQTDADEHAVRLRTRRWERWRGIRKILMLQWRIMALTLALLIQCLYFSSLTWAQQLKATGYGPSNPEAVAFGECLFLSKGDREKCLPLADSFVINKSATLAGVSVMAVSLNH
jgi:hypothetical protein